jgi:hypothetical protein
MRLLDKVYSIFILLREFTVFSLLLEDDPLIICNEAPNTLKSIFISNHLIEVDHVKPVFAISLTYTAEYEVIPLSC